MHAHDYVASMMRKLSICNPADVFPLSGGIVNQTFEVTGRNHDAFIVQRMNPVFSEKTLADQRGVCGFLAASGLSVPDIVTWWQDPDGRLWKVSRKIAHDKGTAIDPAASKLAGAYLGKVHRLLGSYPLKIECSIEGFHDLDEVYGKLGALVASTDPRTRPIRDMSRFVLETGRHERFPQAAPRVIHGDPKWNNFLFKRDKVLSVAGLIDWDTVMTANPLIDLGDMIRSFSKGKDGEFLRDRFEAIVEGYSAEMPEDGLLEKAAQAAKAVTLELAARFIIDIVEDCYFDFDRSKFSTRRDSNIASARKYIDYYRSM